MGRVREEGDFYPQDADGFLLNPTSDANIQKPWRSPVEEAANLVRAHFGDRLHGLYLRGSVAQGTARLGISDLDLIVIVRGDVMRPDAAWCGQLDTAIVSRFPGVHKVDTTLMPLKEVLHPSIQFRLKVNSLFLAGFDLRPRLPRFRPEDRAALQYARQLGRDVGHCLVLVAKPPSAKEWHRVATWIGKSLVRAGFELVMRDVKRYTTDLYPSCQAFAARVPNRATDMRRALEFAAGAHGAPWEVEGLVRDFGLWLSAAVDRDLHLSRPMSGTNLDRAADATPRLILSASDVFRFLGASRPRLRATSSPEGEPCLSLQQGRLEARAPRSFLGFLVSLCRVDSNFTVREAVEWDRSLTEAKVHRLLSFLLESGALERVTPSTEG